MKIKRTLPSIEEQLKQLNKQAIKTQQEKYVKMASFESEKKISSHINLIKDQDRKKEQQIIDQLTNPNRTKIFKNATDRSYKSSMSKNQEIASEKSNLKINRKLNKKQSLFHQENHKRIFHHHSTSFKKPMTQVQPIIESNDDIMTTPHVQLEKQQDHKIKISEKITQHLFPEQQLLVEKISYLQNCFKQLSERVNSQPTTPIKEFKSTGNSQINHPSFELENQKYKNIASSERQRGISSHRYKEAEMNVLKLEQEQRIRCERISQENQRLHNKLKQSKMKMRNPHFVHFQEFQQNQTIHQMNNSEKFQIYSPFMLEENQQNLTFHKS